MRTLTRLLPLLLLVSFALGCSKKSEDPEKNVKWPARPTDGTPMVLEFLKMTREGKDRRAELRVFNFQDKDAKRIHMTLHYQDASGKELKTFPWTVISNPVVEAKKSEVIEVGAFLPEGTTKVMAELREAEFDGGGKWESKKPE